MEVIYSVSEFVDFINLYLEGVNEVTVQGEISSIKLSQGRWYFLTIKDEKSSIDIFAVSTQIPGCTQLQEGMLVNVSGIPKLYKKTGKFSIHATNITPAGEGSLKIAFEKLKQKLQKEGLFDVSRKREIPQFPQKIGLITAKGSQAYQDFTKILNARTKGIKIFFYPASVQGKEALKSITAGLEFFNNQMADLDLIVLTRGGGSLEDLYTFNTEELSRAIYASKIPIITGVGHEGDVTLADLCADLRASTPSNAAELISQETVATLNMVKHLEFKLFTHTQNRVKEYYAQIQNFNYVYETKIRNKIQYVHKGINNFEQTTLKLKNKISLKKQQVEWNSKHLIQVIDNKSKIYNLKLVSLKNYLSALDYKKMLNKGFAVLYDNDGKILKSTKSTKINNTINAVLGDGVLVVKVEEIKND